MKNIFKKAILPLLVFGIAIASVFATNSSTIVFEQPSQPLYTGAFFYKDTFGNCHKIIPEPNPVTMNCTLTNTAVVCTWSVTNAFSGQESSDPDSWVCLDLLYQRTIP